MRVPGRTMPMLLLGFICLAACSPKAEPPAAREAEARYAGYRFDQPGAVDVGTQPLGIPQGSVSELLPRDGVLAGQLGGRGQRVVAHPFLKGKDLYRFLEKGELEAGFLGDMPALTGAAKGDLVVACLVKQGFSSIVSQEVVTVNGLKGKRVATGIGSTAHFTLLNALENEGLSEKDVRLVDMEVGEMAAALARGDIDAFCAWEPTPSAALAAHPEFRMVHRGINYSFFCLRRGFLASHPEEARLLVAAVARGCAWMRGGNVERAVGWAERSAVPLLGGGTGVGRELAAALTRSDLLNVHAAPQMPQRLVRENELLWKEFIFLKRIGKIPESTAWETVRDAFDFGLLRGVQSEPARYAVNRYDYRDRAPQGGK